MEHHSCFPGRHFDLIEELSHQESFFLAHFEPLHNTHLILFNLLYEELEMLTLKADEA